MAEFPENKNPEEDTAGGGGEVDEENVNKKRKKHSPLMRKAPKYDARKAIEEAEAKAGEQGASNIKESKSLSAMIKKNKEEHKKEKEQNENKLQVIKEKEKEADISKQKVNYDEIVIVTNHTKKAKEEINQTNEGGKEGEGQTRRPKVQTTEISMRKKLHDMERSPPPKFNIKAIKSKLDCWASEDQINVAKVKKDHDKVGNVSTKNVEKTKFEANFLEDLARDYENYSNKFSKHRINN